ncbi:protein of unknown function [Paraburkholderia kururiensis]
MRRIHWRCNGIGGHSRAPAWNVDTLRFAYSPLDAASPIGLLSGRPVKRKLLQNRSFIA